VNPGGLRVLAERASAVEGRPDTRLDEVHDRIARARRQRQAGVVGTAVLAVVLALTAGLGLLALTGTDDTPPARPAPNPSPTATPTRLELEGPSVRRLTYATGHTIHWGDRTIDVGNAVQGLGATDDGVVFVRGGGNGCVYAPACRTLWFTDGSAPVRLGTSTGSVIRGFDVQLSAAGSTVVWTEPDPEDRTPYYPPVDDYVVYDTSQRREVGRFGSQESEVLAVLDDHVYWIPGRAWCRDFQRYYGTCRRYEGVMRFDVATGTQQRVSWASYRADRASRERTFVTPFLHEGGVPEPVLSDHLDFEVDGNHLRPDDGNGPAITARLASTGQVVGFRVPSAFTGHDYYPSVMWLDDDRLVIRDDTRGLMVCRVSSGHCRGVVARWVETGFGGHG
jgi:hypothetical protein